MCLMWWCWKFSSQIPKCSQTTRIWETGFVCSLFSFGSDACHSSRVTFFPLWKLTCFWWEWIFWVWICNRRRRSTRRSAVSWSSWKPSMSSPHLRSCALSVGNFTGAKSQEIVVARCNSLELLGFDENGRVNVICASSTFALVRSLISFRLAGNHDYFHHVQRQANSCMLWYYFLGASKDYVVISSDSGKISVVEFDATIRNWKVIHSEVFGRTGCRRTVPGQYLAADPKGRALLIGMFCLFCTVLYFS